MRLKQTTAQGERRVRQLNRIENQYKPRFTLQYRNAFRRIRKGVIEELDKRDKINASDLLKIAVVAAIIQRATSTTYTALITAGYIYANSGLRLVGLSLDQRFTRLASTHNLVSRRSRKNALRMARLMRGEISRIIRTSNGDISLMRQRINAMSGFGLARARRAARSEINYTINDIQQKGWQRAGVRYKEWYTALDDMVCPYCRPMHGRILPIAQEFVPNNTTLPGEPGRSITTYEAVQHPPLHPNCRCTLLPVV